VRCFSHAARTDIPDAISPGVVFRLNRDNRAGRLAVRSYPFKSKSGGGSKAMLEEGTLGRGRRGSRTPESGGSSSNQSPQPDSWRKKR
jgi:hypothetical protein